MAVCPVCYRENEPVNGRCPSCGVARDDAPRTQPEVSFSSAPTLPQKQAQGAAPQNGANPRLILKGLAGDVTEYPLGENNVLGRSTTASVRLADREVSRKHSQIDFENGDYVLRDLGSSNGTYLNGKRIFAPSPLSDGDEVLIGTSKMEFRIGQGKKHKNAEIVHSEDGGKELEIRCTTSTR
jgi:pSer/pThr/pTyr-binding forkhead associated (FHA) protein